MPRREFSKAVKVAAFNRCERAGFKCENPACGAPLTTGRFHYDHVIPDALGGEPTLENCAVVCVVCHAEKTRGEDVPRIAKAKRQEARHIGAVASKGSIPSRPGVTRGAATRPLNKWFGFQRD